MLRTVRLEPVTFVLGVALLVLFIWLLNWVGSAPPTGSGPTVNWGYGIAISAALVFLLSLARGTAIAKSEARRVASQTPA
ncbi:MAG: hypothetical protein L3K00_03050 [Thermoplasmata archaeon]|nr:hypothetical protein [Thermoplasmata archaeon]